MIAIYYKRAGNYVAEVDDGGRIMVGHGVGTWCYTHSEAEAYRWLGDHGLRRGRIKKLLNAAIRNEGPYADPGHPKRIQIQ